MFTTSLFEYFSSYIPLRQTERDALTERVIEKTVRKKGMLLTAGEVCEHYCFVKSGLLKMYTTDPDGAGHNIQFAAEGDWITDNSSFHSCQPSPLNIEALEKSIVLSIGRKELIYLFHHFPKFDRIFRVIVENKYQDLQARMLQNISFTADQRYESFLKSSPALANRLPNTEIASYLGITPEFLSKIRRKLVGK
ncbi:Crp/Fnr family transcriptional regulator [Mucilaginibacter litoreus]|uniref:Crp/Fnr family transcriptional regulator n=1 Tax=Mucilaginibacter litoreus TaxID=1048221 RepID=A0ABW3AWX3_9SPHI